MFTATKESSYENQFLQDRNSFWSINEELSRVFPYMPRITNYKVSGKLKEKLIKEASEMTSRQATVRYLGPEEYLDPRPERGLDRFTTSELWAEVKYRVRSIIDLNTEDELVPWLSESHCQTCAG